MDVGSARGSGAVRRPERRLVTILFADLAGYTALTATLDPEEVHEVVAPLLEQLVGIARAGGGLVNQIWGDGFMAVFGMPRANEDDAVRAVRAGLDIVAAAGAGHGPTPRGRPVPAVHAGVESGEVLVSDHWESAGFKVTGSTATIASRLSSTARPGELLVGPRAYALTCQDLTFGPATTRDLKGIPGPVEVRLATGEASQTAGREPGTVVDRTDSRRSLASVWDDVAAGGGQRIVTLTGDAGIGKTCLAVDLAHRVGVTTPGGLVAHVQCRPRPTGTPFIPLVRGLLAAVAADVVTPLAAIPSSGGVRNGGAVRNSGAVQNSGAVASDRTDALVDLLLDRAGLTDAHVRRALLALLGRSEQGTPAGSPVTRPADVADVLLATISGLARDRPVLVVLDDADRADPDLAALLRGLRSGPPRSVMWLVVCRSGLGLDAVDIHLPPLDPDDSRRLLDQELPAGAGRDVVEPLVRRSAGVPLLLVECARAARDGAVARGAAGSATVLDLDTTVPLTVRGVFAAQLDRLPDGERRAVEDIAVAGGVTRREAFQRTYPAGESSLDSLVARGLVRTVRAPGHPDVVGYELVSPMLGEVAYTSLARADLVLRHHAAAAWLREGTAFDVGDDAAEVAYHEERVWRLRRFVPTGLGDGFATEAGVRAAEALARVARHLVYVSPRGAGEAAGRGLDIVAECPEVPARVRAELHLRHAQALKEAWEFDDALDAAQRAAVEALDTDVDDARLLAEAVLVRGDCLSWLGRMDEARSVLDEAARLLADLHDAIGLARAAHLRAYTWRFSDLARLAVELERAHHGLLAVGEAGPAALIAAELAYMATERDLGTVERWASVAAGIADPADLRLAALLARARGYGAYLRGRWSSAADQLAEARRLGAEAGLRGIEIEAGRVRAACLAAVGRYEEAQVQAREALSRDDHASVARQRAMGLLALAPVALAAGNPAAARARIIEARRILVEIGSEEDLTDVVTAEAALACHAGGPICRPAEGASSDGCAAFEKDVAHTMDDLEGYPLLVVPLAAATARLRLLTDPAGAVDLLRAAADRARAAGADGHGTIVELCVRQAELLSSRPVPAGPRPSDPLPPDPLPPDRAGTPEARALAAECDALVALRRGEMARPDLARAVAAWRDHGDSVWHARVLLWRGERAAATAMLTRLDSPLRPADLLASLPPGWGPIAP